MYSSGTFCHYHPSKRAVTSCQRCKRPICADDRRIYKVNTQQAFNKVEVDYCILCYATLLRQKFHPEMLVIFIPVMLFFAFLASGSSSSKGAGYIVGLIITIPILGIAMINNNNKIKKAEQDALDFKKSISLEKDNNTTVAPFHSDKSNNTEKDFDFSYLSKNRSDLSKQEIFSIHCYDCGAKIDLDDKFCQNCGDSTKEELDSYYKTHKSVNN